MATIPKHLLWIAFNVLVFGAIYFYGRKWHPQLSLLLAISGCTVMTILCVYQSSVWAMASFILCMIFMFILRRPDQRAGFTLLFAKNNIHTTQHFSAPALQALGDKKWQYANASIKMPCMQVINYSMWQGLTSHFVAGGKHGGTNSHTYYLAFIFAPGTISNDFKKRVQQAADRSGRTTLQKIKFQINPDTETPEAVYTAKDGSFIIEYITLREVACYERRINWVRDNINPAATPSKLAVQ